MYNNYDYYDFAYFDPNRPRAPRLPFSNIGYGADFFVPRPDFGGFRPTHPRMPISDWGRQLVHQQINKSQDRWMRPFRPQTPKRHNTSHKQPNKPKPEESPSPAQANGENKPIAKKDDNTPAKPENGKPTVLIPAKMSAKEMWESSYKEPVVIDVAKALDPPPKSEPPQNVMGVKRKKNKGRKEPYYKRRFAKKKKPTAASEGAASEPGFGFDIDAATPVPEAKNDNKTSETYPKVCKICNAQLTGEVQADQHYKGEAHKKNINKFLSGQALGSVSTKIDQINSSLPLPTNTPECLRWDPDSDDRTTNTVRFCRLCSVRMTSLPNAKQHYSGKSHAKRIRIVERGQRPVRKQFKVTQFISGGTLGMKADEACAPQANYALPPTYHQTQNSVAVNTPTFNMRSALPAEFSNSMTPSGQFYCQSCNVTIENAAGLNSHLQSKAHKQAKYRMK